MSASWKESCLSGKLHQGRLHGTRSGWLNLPKGGRILRAAPRAGPLVLVLALLATGCSGSSNEGATTTQKRESQSDLAPRIEHSAGFSLAVPRSWKAVSSDDLDTLKAQQLEADPYLARLLDELPEPGQIVRLIAVDNAVHEDHQANCSVVVDAASSR